ncbi:unnamed protein product [Blepharisma stoltei]|uniref:Secreted protein n=1 Tax=Blepharisma stoltei TaxID=1481888 RepID=A0AAU9JLE9_9CILI|nr:unnamed protein product [Blepharisma stoltei]
MLILGLLWKIFLWQIFPVLLLLLANSEHLYWSSNPMFYLNKIVYILRKCIKNILIGLLMNASSLKKDKAFAHQKKGRDVKYESNIYH